MDWAKYTDEGWYGDAAIRYFQRGHWHVPGDFNPAAALPVWPLLELGVFHVTGVSLTAARGLTVFVFVLIVLASFLLLRRWQRASGPQREPGLLMPSVAVLLLAVSPFCYAFTRIAILEPLLILLTLLALLAASMRRRTILAVISLGILLPLMVLTKTTAVFLTPSIFWMLWATCGYRLRPFLRAAWPPAAMASVLWTGYYFLIVRPHFLADYRYLFDANAYTFITPGTALAVLRDTVLDGLWMGKVLYPLACAALVAVLVVYRRSVHPLIVALALWVAGYAAFLAYHNNLQPRYYLVLAVPMTLLLPLACEELARRAIQTDLPRPLIGVVAAILVAAIAIPDALQMLDYVRTPEYTLVRAAEQLRRTIDADPQQNRLLLSISGSELSLITGIPSICDDFGTMELPDRVSAYRPGWYAAWNLVEDDKMEALAPMYHLSRVAEFPAMDDPERNLLILYRLDPPETEPSTQHQRRPIPPSLRTKLGQQPSVDQLQH